MRNNFLYWSISSMPTMWSYNLYQVWRWSEWCLLIWQTALQSIWSKTNFKRYRALRYAAAGRCKREFQESAKNISFILKLIFSMIFCPILEKNFYYQKPKYKTWELKIHVWRLKLVNCLSKELYQASWPDQEVFSFSKLKIFLKKVSLLSIWQMTNDKW